MPDAPRPATYRLNGALFTAPPPAPGLYVVATPIGNLGDVTLRALEVLAGVALVLCEDTRTTARLMAAYDIRTPRSALHEHNERARIGPLLERLGAGEALALVSDAGTPLVSDPGFPLVRAAREAGLPVFAVPGASALTAALAVAGLPTDAFGFFGFLPTRAGARARALAGLAERPETLVFYESPRRLGASLSAMAEAFGPDREAAVALELTKRFERLRNGTLGELAAGFVQEETKGEAVILVAGADSPEPVARGEWQAALAAALAKTPLREAVDEVTARFGLRRKEVYSAALALKARK